MAIQFARVQYVSRSTGGNACRKAAYNSRTSIKCERTGEVFNFKGKDDLDHHEIILPEGVSDKFKNSTYLWNAAENAERRVDSQVAKESVIALPDDKIITKEDRIELARRYAEVMFVSKGLGSQIDIHAPHDGENNWHAHFLATTRGFSQDGESLASHKARETDPTIRKGYIKEEQSPGDIWAQIQRNYFKEKGYDLEVDPTGVIAQEHLGPVRMRAHLTGMVARAEMLKEANEEAVKEPGAILKRLTDKNSVFREGDLTQLLNKFVDSGEHKAILDKVMAHRDFVQLYDESGQATGYFTTREVREEEQKLLRFADKIHERGHVSLTSKTTWPIITARSLTREQEMALKYVVEERRGLALVEGRAGTGKSYTMNAIREAYESCGKTVIGLAPTHVVAGDMAKDGFGRATTVHKLLFDLKNGKTHLPTDSVVIVDEAAMLGNRVLVELFHRVKEQGCKLVLFGDPRQLPSVDRGGIFSALVEKYGSTTLSEVRRQKILWQKDVSELMGDGSHEKAIKVLHDAKAIDWKGTKEESIASLVEDWKQSYLKDPQGDRLVLAHRNVHVDVLNRALRDIRLSLGDIDNTGFEITTQRGREIFSRGDRVAFTKTDKDLGVSSGFLGTIQSIGKGECLVKLDNGKEVSFNPGKYEGMKLGYASTIYKAQGKTIEEIYVLHDKHVNRKISYVALSRQEKVLKVYVNEQETKSMEKFVEQVSKLDGKMTTLGYVTAQQLERQARNQNTPVQMIRDAIGSVTTAIKDKFHRNEAFYTFVKAERKHLTPVKEVNQEKIAKDLLKEPETKTQPSLSPEDRTKIQETISKYRLDASFGKPTDKTLESINEFKTLLQETNKALNIPDNPTELSQKATFMAMQVQHLAKFNEAVEQSNLTRTILVAANIWFEHKDKDLGQKFGFNNDVAFMAGGQMKANDKLVQESPDKQIQIKLKEVIGQQHQDLPLSKIQQLDQQIKKIDTKALETYKAQQDTHRQQEQQRQLQRAHQKGHER